MSSELKLGDRWFLQLYDDADIARLRKLGRLYRFEGANGLAPFPWVEIITRKQSLSQFQGDLEAAGIRVRKLVPVMRGMGATLAKQTEIPGAFE